MYVINLGTKLHLRSTQRLCQIKQYSWDYSLKIDDKLEKKMVYHNTVTTPYYGTYKSNAAAFVYLG